MLIGIVGLNGSGKDSAGQYLVTQHNFVHKDLGQEIRDELKRLGKNNLDRTEMIALGNERRQNMGFNYWCKRAIESVNSKYLVITSIRNPSEAEEIINRCGTLVNVFAEQHVRFERTIAKIENDPTKHGDINSFEDFKAKESIELFSSDPSKQQLLKCISMAKYKIDNNGSTEQFHSQIEQLLETLKK
jgi:dephospho-CoA kinase